MIDLLKSDGVLLWHTHDYKLKFKRFVIRFDVELKKLCNDFGYDTNWNLLK